MKKFLIRLKELVSLCFSIFIFILTIEVSARVDDKIKYDAPLWGRYGADQLRTYDSDGIRCNVPNSHFEKWENNQFGFRGPAISLEKPEGIIRIVCMGTSETYGLYESPGKEWPAQLGELLNNYHQFQVIDASTVGLPMKDYRAYMEKYVLKFNPDIVILFIDPIYYAIVLERSSQKSSSPKRKPANNPQKSFKFSLKNIISNFRSLPKIKQVIKQIIPPKLLKLYQIRDTTKQVQAAERLRLKGGKTPKDVVPPEYLESFRTDLIELIIFLHDHNIKVILSTYPSLISKENIDKYYEIILDNRKFCVEFSFEGMLDASWRLNEVIKAVAAEYRIGFVDNNRLLPKNTRYFADNVHYTDEGARLIATHIAEHIRQEFLYTSSSPFGKVSNRGDN